MLQIDLFEEGTYALLGSFIVHPGNVFKVTCTDDKRHYHHVVGEFKKYKNNIVPNENLESLEEAIATFEKNYGAVKAHK